METEANVRITKEGVVVDKFCYNCGFYTQNLVVGPHSFRCMKCNKPPNDGHFYKSKHRIPSTKRPTKLYEADCRGE